MRVRFRIAIHKDGRRLSREELLNRREPFWVGVRYITEFKYLEATKWLMLAEDSHEKYLLLCLTSLALGQSSQAEEYCQEAKKFKPSEGIGIYLELPERGLKAEVKGDIPKEFVSHII
ncbi:hypothetical protein [Thermocrinis sp.]